MLRALLLSLLLSLAGCAHLSWAFPVRGGECPKEYLIKGNMRTGYYHTPDSPYYHLVRAQVRCFKTDVAARNAGLRPADPRFRDARLP